MTEPKTPGLYVLLCEGDADRTCVVEVYGNEHDGLLRWGAMAEACVSWGPYLPPGSTVGPLPAGWTLGPSIADLLAVRA